MPEGRVFYFCRMVTVSRKIVRYHWLAFRKHDFKASITVFFVALPLAKPAMFVAVWRQGREQFLPFVVTIGAILFTDLLIGVLIGVAYSVYFLIKHTYRAGYTVKEKMDGHTRHFTIELALNVSFLNKKRIADLLDNIPEYATVEIIGTDSVYIDHDILEIFQQFKSKAHNRHIQLTMKDIAEVQTIELH